MFGIEEFNKEASYMLASCKPEDRNRLIAKYNDMREIISILDKSIIPFDIILKDVAKYLKTDVLDYLTLKDDEFNTTPSHEGFYHNLRYSDIYKDSNGVIYRRYAYFIEFNKLYNNNIKSVIDDNHFKRETDTKIYIQDAGYISNKYFKDVIIRPEHIGLFALQSKVVLPINRLFNGNKDIYFINKNNAKFKVLKEFYDVPIYEDPNMLDENGLAIYNIRNFKQI